MTGPKGNSEFVSPRALMFPLVSLGFSWFPVGPVIKCSVLPSNTKTRKICKKKKKKTFA